MRSPIKVLDNGAWPGPAGPAAPRVEIVVPVRNEERDLPPSIIRGVIRMGGGRQATRFLGVGVACTIAYVLLFLALRGVMGAQAANALSLLVTAVANTALNRSFTFGVRGRRHAVRHQLRGLLAFGAGLLLTSRG